jgi:hypothetical protein
MCTSTNIGMCNCASEEISACTRLAPRTAGRITIQSPFYLIKIAILGATSLRKRDGTGKEEERKREGEEESVCLWSEATS